MIDGKAYVIAGEYDYPSSERFEELRAQMLGLNNDFQRDIKVANGIWMIAEIELEERTANVNLLKNPRGNAFWSYNELQNDELAKKIMNGGGSAAKVQFVNASTWSGDISINRELTGTSSSGILQAKQVEKDNWTGPTGSLITGSSGDDIIRGLAGWDILDGGAGDDLIHGGNGRDVITGGTGSDELHGDFGWNTYKDQRDGSVDLIAIKSDQFLSNWWYGKAGNSPNGEKSDIIEGLDSTDQIKIIGVATSDLSFRDGISHKGVTGIGIYAKGVLEALYTGGDLSVSQISSITTGDNSVQAMANQLWSYWGDNTVPALQA